MEKELTEKKLSNTITEIFENIKTKDMTESTIYHMSPEGKESFDKIMEEEAKKLITLMDEKEYAREVENGFKGELTDFMNQFKLQPVKVFKQGYKRNDKCPCDSGKKVKNCHTELLETTYSRG
jgi:uncharacterized protein YecA (UPF0149 family)